LRKIGHVARTPGHSRNATSFVHVSGERRTPAAHQPTPRK
jgi:hypothetical protein